MGKWVEVQCNCKNRTPIPNSDFLFGRPHRKKRRLTNREKQEVEEWERTTMNMYECGHRSGVLIEFWPGDIIRLGSLVAGILYDTTNNFEVFTKVGDWRCYDDELLLISPGEAHLWLIEIDEVRLGLRGVNNLPTERVERLVVEFYRVELGSRIDLENRLDQIQEEMPMARIAGLRRNVQQSRWPDMESAIEKIETALRDAANLCDTSIECGNPIRLLW
jgi:hypothetical protein